ncbi:molybdenum cofactor guanylyltransferase [Pelotomaculum propionicicum]|uniref:Probable molybdenum cofactor guanylyltransferase n=1 Tax=Pelotomaculum propionicicum TaxID=258475 RepID=A0A4Y7RKU2_9FIRM|nr:molybdenum cofactor guanylyltransferase [Pelotomaculum propionicicum]NLI11376.1 molybdenum cofactor guanylyltransferase [Peptococcaceae bacterium]TEB09595.1 Molybdenum cofactor guanylyltransferase [Pelotomaculum propionicicum]
MTEVAGVILAGGKSRRMGTDKAFLTVGREAMIERVAAELRKVFKEILISGGDEETGRRLGLRVIPDLIKGGGPLSGIHATLIAAQSDKCLVVPCDMPFLSAELAKIMISQSEGYDVTVPQHGDYLQPLFAVYSKSCIPAIEEALNNNRHKVVDFYPRVRVKYVSEAILKAAADIDTVFFNVNTPFDLEKARIIDKKKKKVRRVNC